MSANRIPLVFNCDRYYIVLWMVNGLVFNKGIGFKWIGLMVNNALTKWRFRAHIRRHVHCPAPITWRGGRVKTGRTFKLPFVIHLPCLNLLLNYLLSYDLIFLNQVFDIEVFLELMDQGFLLKDLLLKSLQLQLLLSLLQIFLFLGFTRE